MAKMMSDYEGSSEDEHIPLDLNSVCETSDESVSLAVDILEKFNWCGHGCERKGDKLWADELPESYKTSFIHLVHIRLRIRHPCSHSIVFQPSTTEFRLVMFKFRGVLSGTHTVLREKYNTLTS